MGRLPYILALYFLRLIFLFRRIPLELWPRNSFLTSAFVPFKSDLDLTAVSKQELPWSTWKMAAGALTQTKKFFPALGEVNCYSRDNWNLIRDIANPLEILRDPRLLQELKGNREATEEEKTCWLLRLAYADRHNLRLRPHERLAKWQQHFSWAGKPLLPFTEMQELLEQILPKSLVPAVKGMFVSDQIPLHLHPDQPWWQNELLLLFPQHYCFLVHLTPAALKHSWLLPLCRAQIQWEIFGAYTQFRLHSDATSLLKHIAKLQIFCRTLEITEWDTRWLYLRDLLSARQD